MKPEKAIVILRMGEQARWRSGVTVEEEKEALDMAIESLKGRPHGEWKKVTMYESFCSNCNNAIDRQYFTDEPPFCPNCGASMRKEGDEK